MNGLGRTGKCMQSGYMMRNFQIANKIYYDQKVNIIGDFEHKESGVYVVQKAEEEGIFKGWGICREILV